jgi:hypothetical protein
MGHRGHNRALFLTCLVTLEKSGQDDSNHTMKKHWHDHNLLGFFWVNLKLITESMSMIIKSMTHIKILCIVSI